jgi:hypothetical protein
MVALVVRIAPRAATAVWISTARPSRAGDMHSRPSRLRRSSSDPNDGSSTAAPPGSVRLLRPSSVATPYPSLSLRHDLHSSSFHD